MGSIWFDGIVGFIVGDALGVPVEFLSREDRNNDPVIGMREYGTHNQPLGTWSDDSSLTLATLDSINKCNGVDYKDMMERFCSWALYGEYTPFGEVFDIGISTSCAIMNYERGETPNKSGGTTERDNGNGSLMRILPICLYLYEYQKRVCTSENEAIYIIHNVSALTHGHIRSQVACGIYYFIVKAIIEKDGNLINRLQKGIKNAFVYYRNDIRNYAELSLYERISDLEKFSLIPEKNIKSTGYVVDTLEAVIWSLITTSSYVDAVLRAVNLGEDTDTIAAITGGLAGLYYGIDAIPSEWKDSIQRKDMIQILLEER